MIDLELDPSRSGPCDVAAAGILVLGAGQTATASIIGGSPVNSIESCWAHEWMASLAEHRASRGPDNPRFGCRSVSNPQTFASSSRGQARGSR